MGNASSMLTQYDIEEVQEHCDNLYEFLSIPEFAVNPLSQRLLRMVDGLNFKDFVAFLSAFSSHASLQQNIEHRVV